VALRGRDLIAEWPKVDRGGGDSHPRQDVRGTTPRWLAVATSLLRSRSMVSGCSRAPPAKARGWAASGAPTVLSRPDSGEWVASR
jgi:hypothetical protein